MTASSFTATTRTANYTTQRVDTRTRQFDSKAQAETWIGISKWHAGDTLLSAEIFPTPEPVAPHIQTRQERVAEVLHQIQAEEDARELEKIRTEGANYRPTNFRSPNPIVR